ncbi:MAG: hypothetical protein A2Y33_15755 [Spirochaetes bacterium GWF1_51_8]|nr:MAG: hypothetical protein A2Y33_15755 [Spirochaetes bacterium GWF1_51_8]
MPKVGMEPIRRKQITEAVLEIISSGGLDAVTIERVAEKAGVSKGVVIYYFHGKDELIVESYRAFLEYYKECIAGCVDTGMTAWGLLEAIGDGVFGVFDEGADSVNGQSPEKMARIFVHFYTLTLLNPGMRNIYEEYYKDYIGKTAMIVEMGIASGELRQTDPLVFAHGFIALLDGLLLMRLLGYQTGGISVKDIYIDYLRKSLLSEGVSK